MKKTLFIAALAITLTACSVEPTVKSSASDSTKVDSTQVDTCMVPVQIDSTKKDSI